MKAKNSFQWGLKRARKINKSQARKLHLKIVEPKPNELQIDIDGARALRRYGLQFSILDRAQLTIGWRERITPSRRKNHAHVTITLPKRINDIERVCLQAILSSDLSREAFNYVRVKNRNRYPIVFFEKEQKQ